MSTEYMSGAEQMTGPMEPDATIKLYHVKVGVKGGAGTGVWLHIKTTSQEQAISTALDGRDGYEVRAIR